MILTAASLTCTQQQQQCLQQFWCISGYLNNWLCRPRVLIDRSTATVLPRSGLQKKQLAKMHNSSITQHCPLLATSALFSMNTSLWQNLTGEDKGLEGTKSPQVSQTALTLGTEADLGPGHIVLDGVSAPTKGAQQPPLFGHVYCGHGRQSQLLLSSCCCI